MLLYILKTNKLNKKQLKYNRPNTHLNTRSELHEDLFNIFYLYLSTHYSNKFELTQDKIMISKK